jgi:hypothetical protein
MENGRIVNCLSSSSTRPHQIPPFNTDAVPEEPTMPEQTNWRMRAACRYINPELFFPKGTEGPAL